jgi:chemotaxis protein methyltransferase CheR
MAGQLSPEDAGADALETRLFLQALEGRFGVDFLGFEAGPMQAKLEACLAASGAESISALQGRALRDELLGADVIRALNRSNTATPGEVFHQMALRCALLPLLRSAPWPAVWLADCTDAHVPVLLLALLHEENLLERTRVFVTSGAEHALDDLRALRLSGADVERLQALHHSSGGQTHLTRHLRREGDTFTLDPALRAPLSWHVHHLGTDASFREFHAILAPRPLAEYGDALRARALRVFSASLCPFGVLQLDDGGCSRAALLGERFEPVLGDYGVYRRIG